MPVQPTYPGVYVQEVPSGVRTIMGVATSIAAFVGRACKGPVNDPVIINSYADYERKFGGLWLKSTMSFAVRDFFLNGGSQAIIVRLNNAATTAWYEIPTADNAKKLKIEAASPGSWGNNFSIWIDHITKDASDTTLFNLTVTETNGLTEKFLNVSVSNTSPSYLPKVLEQRSDLIRVKVTGNIIECPDIRPSITAQNSPITIENANKGTDGLDLVNNQYATGQNLESNKEGIYALEKADLFNLLCIPPYSFTADIGSDVLAKAAEYCRKRRAFLIVDPRSNWTKKSTAQTEFTAANNSYPGITGTFASYAAIYFPRLKQPNPLNDNLIEEFVPCGAVAGVIAKTDSQRGVWKAPAGQEACLLGVPELSVSLTDMENGDLNQLGINCLRAFPVYGRIVWGARTLDGADRLASEWKYLPVRRTALFIEESLYRGLKWVVFEPNDEPLWAQIRLNVGAFMHNLFIQGAFQGQTSKEAYFVKCDKDTTTQNDINQGIVNIWVGFAPLKPAEFVILHIQQMAGKINQ
jgi:uncharacterized protein